ncbi:glutamine synthetase beta-grasp domain-containing protein [Candidatus Micrarchaeota archaeon]|nr:glutamine synthetase beta-grasp domain-containing protein [Candidatus Micrarchaeota archaeon]
MTAVDEVLKYIATNEIKWVDFQFFGINGQLHRVSLSKNEFDETSFSKGVNAANLLKVFEKEETDLLLLPDPDTSARIPWEVSTIRLICNIATAVSNERFLKDSRYVIERVETNLSAMGIKNAKIAADVEFHIFETVTTDRTAPGRGSGSLMDSREAWWGPSAYANKKNGSFVAQPTDTLYAARVQISDTLEENFGVAIDSHSHGSSPTGQQSLSIGELGLKQAADALVTTKFVARNLTAIANATCTFMPLAVQGEGGSSLNIKQSLWKTADSNIFYDANDSYAQLSQNGRYYIGGLLEHAPALCVFANPTSNSYKRLAVNPMFLGWSKINKQAAVQVPHQKKNDRDGKAVVYKLSDPSVNSYLAYAAVLAAGIDGIKNKTDPGDPTDDSSKLKGKMKKMPESLRDAIEALESDTKFIKGIFPPELLGDYLDLKLFEHMENQKAVSGHELNRYFDV